MPTHINVVHFVNTFVPCFLFSKEKKYLYKPFHLVLFGKIFHNYGQVPKYLTRITYKTVTRKKEFNAQSSD